MYVVDVLPITPGAPTGTLSYRSSVRIPQGSIVSVPLRRRRVSGIALSCEPVRESKVALKSASYALSGSIGAVTGRVPQPFMDAVAQIAIWHAAGRGATLSGLIGELVKAGVVEALGMRKGRGFVLTPLELPLSQRRLQYHDLIETARSRKKTVLFIVSTLAEVEFWKKEFAAHKVVVLSGTLTGARRTQALERARTQAPAVVISTPTFALVPLPTLTQIVIERAGAGGFRMPRRPYLDMRVALIEYARAYAQPLTLADFPLPLEFRKGARKGFTQVPSIELLDTRTPQKRGVLRPEKQEQWSAVPQELQRRIDQELSEGGRVAVLAVRKGYAPVVICRDCGESLKDERGSLYTFSQQGGERLFRTSDGKSVRAADNKCPTCESWNLLPLGVGVERVAEELRQAFPKAPLVSFDAATARTAQAAKKQLAALSEPGALVVGTEAMVPWLLAAAPAPLSLAAIASADSLLALPFWRSRERFLRLSYLFAETASASIICTRLPNDTAMGFLRDPGNAQFFEEEESLRRSLGYPPFGTLISLSFEGTLGALDTLGEQVREVLGGCTVRQIADRPIRGNVLRRTFVLTLPADQWPNAELSARLAGLPPSVRVIVDPESFW